MSAIDSLTPARDTVHAANAKAKRKAAPRVSAEDGFGLALLDAQEAAIALLDAHGGSCDCSICYGARGVLFPIETAHSIVVCDTTADEAPLLWERRHAGR
jgi:hypothetical protein